MNTQQTVKTPVQASAQTRPLYHGLLTTKELQERLAQKQA